MQHLNNVALSALVKASTGFQKFRADTKGVTAIEYGLIAGLIAVGIVGTLTALKGNLTNLFGTVSSNLQSA
jgi:pilus assembly protein Flp/PilA